jgi:GntR family carbon starvation induced transcriptional regulator
MLETTTLAPPDDVDSVRTMASTLEALLRRDIIIGELKPNSKLRIKELSERYDAGTIPLREALSRLCAGGFVVAIDQKGFRVSGISVSELEDITRTRQEIERLAITRAIHRRDPQWEGEVLAAHHLLGEIPVYDPLEPDHINAEWEHAHDRFHEILTAGCRSGWLQRFATMLRDQTARYRHLSVTAPRGHDRDVVSEHDEIVKAVMSRDVELASSLLAVHFGRTAELVAAAMGSKNI